MDEGLRLSLIEEVPVLVNVSEPVSLRDAVLLELGVPVGELEPEGLRVIVGEAETGGVPEGVGVDVPVVLGVQLGDIPMDSEPVDVGVPVRDAVVVPSGVVVSEPDSSSCQRTAMAMLVAAAVMYTKYVSRASLAVWIVHHSCDRPAQPGLKAAALTVATRQLKSAQLAAGQPSPTNSVVLPAAGDEPHVST